MTRAFADYMVFVDESGSPGMGNIDPHYPLFVLAFFIGKKGDYITQIAPALQQFKFQHFGHDQVILHERDIRKDLGDFAFLKTPALKDAFLSELTTLIEAAPFDLVCVVIDKAQYKTPVDPYHLSLGFGLERVCGLPAQRGVWRSGPAEPGGVTANPAAHVVVEKRGKSEDDEKGPGIRRSQLSAENPQSFLGSLVGFAAEREGNPWRLSCRRRRKAEVQAVLNQWVSA